MNKGNFEWGFDKIEFKVNLKEEVDADGYKKIVIPFIFIVTVLSAFLLQSWEILFSGLFLTALYSMAIGLCELSDKVKGKVNVKLEEQRTNRICATITRIQYEPEADYDYVRIIAQYALENGDVKTFKSKKVIGKAICEIGDNIEILIAPDNPSNYEVKISDCIV